MGITSRTFRHAATRGVGVALLCFAGGLGGCATSRPPALPQATQGLPVGAQLAARQPNLRLYPFSTLLDFESPSDAVFVKASNARRVDGTASTGTGSLELGQGVVVARINLQGLTLGREFPGDWTLVVGHVLAESEANVSFAFAADEGPTLAPQYRMPAGQWVPLLLEVPADAAAAGELVLQVQAEAGAKVYFDDLLLVDNRRSWPEAAQEAEAWLEQVGTRLVARPATGEQTLRPTRPGVEPFEVREAGKLRAVLADPHAGLLALWRDGRLLGHETPATPPCRLEVAEADGRLLTTTPGDADNDGFNEALGAFQLEAARPTMQLRLLPVADGQRALPAFEVVGMPAGEVLVSVEGKLIRTHDRLSDGRVLVVLPVALQRPTQVEVRVRG